MLAQLEELSASCWASIAELFAVRLGGATGDADAGTEPSLYAGSALLRSALPHQRPMFTHTAPSASALSGAAFDGSVELRVRTARGAVVHLSAAVDVVTARLRVVAEIAARTTKRLLAQVSACVHVLAPARARAWVRVGARACVHACVHRCPHVHVRARVVACAEASCGGAVGVDRGRARRF